VGAFVLAREGLRLARENSYKPLIASNCPLSTSCFLVPVVLQTVNIELAGTFIINSSVSGYRMLLVVTPTK